MTKIEEKMLILNQASARSVIPMLCSDRNWSLTAKAEFAKEMIRTGMIACTFGEAKESYQENKTMPVTDVVKRACDIAEETYEEFGRRGWLLPVPFYDDMVKQLEGAAPKGPGF